MTTSSHEEIIFDENQEKLWSEITNLAAESKISDVNRAVLAFIDASATQANGDTSRIIIAIESRLRRANSNIFCIARRAHAPLFCAKTHAGRECEYYLQLANSEANRAALLESEKCVADTNENQQRLMLCGLRVFDAAATAAEHRKKNPHLYLPVDLSRTEFADEQGRIDRPHFYYDAEALKFYNSGFDVSVLQTYATETAENRVSKALLGTGLVPMRTLVPIAMWAQSCAVLKNQAAKRLAFMQTHVVDSVYEQMIPVGYQVFGTIEKSNYLLDAATVVGIADGCDDAAGDDAKSAHQKSTRALTEKHVVFEIYAAPLRRFHIDVSQSEYDAILTCNDAEKFKDHLAVLAKRASVDVDEFSQIKTWSQLERNIFLNIV